MLVLLPHPWRLPLRIHASILDEFMTNTIIFLFLRIHLYPISMSATAINLPWLGMAYTIQNGDSANLALLRIHGLLVQVRGNSSALGFAGRWSRWGITCLATNGGGEGDIWWPLGYDPMTRVVNGGKLENTGKILEVNGGFLQQTMFDYQIMGNIMEDIVI